MISRIFFIAISLLFFGGCQAQSQKCVNFDDQRIEYMGRIGKTDSTAEIYWSGSSVKLVFDGPSISAVLQDEKGENYFNVILDGDSVRILRPDTQKRTFILAEGLPPGKHFIQLFKRTEWTQGKTLFWGFVLNNNTKVLAIPPKEKSIEFYGNSITCGYAVENYTGGDSPDSIYTNNYNSYAAITARYFDVGYTSVSRSGIGVMVSWVDQIMPEMYNLLNPNDPESLWDFNKNRPDIVVVNLLQNDSWLVKKNAHAQFKKRFGNTPPQKKEIIKAYADFIKTLRDIYPKAQIICMLGNMDITQEGSPWPEYVREAVSSLQDKNILTLFVPFKKTPGHPRVEDQKLMADSLIKLIEQKMKW